MIMRWGMLAAVGLLAMGTILLGSSDGQRYDTGDWDDGMRPADPWMEREPGRPLTPLPDNIPWFYNRYGYPQPKGYDMNTWDLPRFGDAPIPIGESGMTLPPNEDWPFQTFMFVVLPLLGLGLGVVCLRNWFEDHDRRRSRCLGRDRDSDHTAFYVQTDLWRPSINEVRSDKKRTSRGQKGPV